MFKLPVILLDAFGHTENNGFTDYSFFELIALNCVIIAILRSSKLWGFAVVNWVLHSTPQEEIHWRKTG